MKFTARGEGAWCHLCGNSESKTVDVSYPSSPSSKSTDNKYIRICSDCIKKMQDVLKQTD